MSFLPVVLVLFFMIVGCASAAFFSLRRGRRITAERELQRGLRKIRRRQQVLG